MLSVRLSFGCRSIMAGNGSKLGDVGLKSYHRIPEQKFINVQMFFSEGKRKLKRASAHRNLPEQ